MSTVRDVQQVTRAFSAIGHGATIGMRRGVRVWLERVGAESQKEVPKSKGDKNGGGARLAGSMRIAVSENQPVVGTITYDAPYAVPVHEIPAPPAVSVGGRSARHASPTKWKYLEDPFKRLEPTLESTVAEECAKMMKGAV